MSDKQAKMKKLRQRLVQLREDRKKATLEKGLAAQDNKDLRENATYDYWQEKEFFCTARIYAIIEEIEKLARE